MSHFLTARHTSHFLCPSRAMRWARVLCCSVLVPRVCGAWQQQQRVETPPSNSWSWTCSGWQVCVHVGTCACCVAPCCVVLPTVSCGWLSRAHAAAHAAHDSLLTPPVTSALVSSATTQVVLFARQRTTPPLMTPPPLCCLTSRCLFSMPTMCHALTSPLTICSLFSNTPQQVSSCSSA